MTYIIYIIGAVVLFHIYMRIGTAMRIAETAQTKADIVVKALDAHLASGMGYAELKEHNPKFAVAFDPAASVSGIGSVVIQLPTKRGDT